METGCSRIVEDKENRIRKRHCNPEAWKRTKAKRARYAPKSLPIFPQCGHKGEPYQLYQCTSHLNMTDVKKFHELFYGRTDKTAQDTFILTFCTGVPPKRKRPRVNNRAKSKTHAVSIAHTIKTVEGQKILVCREAFLGVLGIKKDRIIRLVKKFEQTGLPPTETRGGDKQSEILNPEGYINIVEPRVKVLKMGQDFKVFDWKKETQRILKSPSNWHFKFKPCKRFIFTKSKDTILIRGETLYRNDMGQAKVVCKRGLKITGMKPKELNIEVPLKPDKIESIESLLSIHYGENYRVNPALQYLLQLFECNKEIVGAAFDENSEPEDTADAK